MATGRATESTSGDDESNDAKVGLDFKPVSLQGFVSEQETHPRKRGVQSKVFGRG